MCKCSIFSAEASLLYDLRDTIQNKVYIQILQYKCVQTLNNSLQGVVLLMCVSFYVLKSSDVIWMQ